MKLLIATTNPAKMGELSAFLAPLKESGVELVSLSDLDITEEPEETGTTIEANSELKAKYYAEKSGLPVIADDGGFEIDYLNGAPGVKSNRWLGYKASDEELIAHTLKKLEGVPWEQRGAALALCLTYYNPSTQTMAQVKERIEGHVAEKPAPHFLKGFPYRALHVVLPFNKYYDELTKEEHEQVNHRMIAVHKLLPTIKKDLLP